MKLDVYVQKRHVGVLEQTGITEFIFTYLPDAPPDLAVSLLMPVRSKSWISPTLHPVFQISLPEGALRQTIERVFAKNFDRFGDTELLAVVGENLIGQIQAVPQGTHPSGRTTNESLANLLTENLKTLVRHYLQDRPGDSGVSGGFLKFLARSPTDGQGKRTTLAFDQWIVKLNDPDHSHIVLLEHFGMMTAREMGLPTAATHLSEDRDRLLVKRFDRDAEGQALGFEDMCALHGLPARDKFSGSAERIVKTIRAFCPGIEGQQSCEMFYAQYLLAATIRNGDAHLKNFGLLYAPGRPATLSPVYDMLSMAVYAPRDDSGDALDGMALTLAGTRRWPKKTTLDALARLCLVSSARRTHWNHALAHAVLSTADAVLDFQQNYIKDGFAQQAARMLDLWACGIAEIDTLTAQTLHEKAQILRKLSAA